MNKNYTYQGYLNCDQKIFQVLMEYLPIDQSFTIKICDDHQKLMYEALLDINVLKQMDPSVLATFGNVQGMYEQFYEIIKQSQNQIKPISSSNIPSLVVFDPQKGILRVKIEIGLKSGKKFRQLILETEKRKMTQYEILFQRMNKSEQKSKQCIDKLTKKVADLQQKLGEQKQKNIKLEQQVNKMNKKYSDQVEQLHKTMLLDRKKHEKQIQFLKQNIDKFKIALNQLEFDVKLLAKSQLKIRPRYHPKCKNIINQSDKSSKKNYYIQKQQQNIVSIAKRGTGWAQFMLQQHVNTDQLSYYDFKITRSRNQYICCGFGTQTCLSEQDSKWSNNSITLFLLDSSIINCGKSDSVNQLQEKQISSKHKMKEQKIVYGVGQKSMRVIIDPLSKKIQWFINRGLAGCIEIGEDFMKAIKEQKVHPLIISCDEGDQIQLL